MYYDALYFLFLLPPLVLSLVASGLLHFWFNKYSNRRAASGMTGNQLALMIAEQQGLQIQVGQIGGNLSDNYDPRNHRVSLSERVANTPSIAALAVAAHELGHVAQHQQGSLLFRARQALVPAVQIGSNLGYILIIIGLLLAATGLAWVGLFLFSFTAIFSLLTLPVELDASYRGLQFLRTAGILQASEMGGARKVLFAAALTYVAALLSSLLNVAYFAMQISGAARRSD